MTHIMTPEQVTNDADLAEFERYLDFCLARGRVVRAFGALPFVAVPGAWDGTQSLVTRLLSFDARRPWRIELPFGWTTEKAIGRNAVIVGPSWHMLPRRWLRELRWWFYDTAVRIELAHEPYEGCWYSELVWFPDAPRFK